MCWGMCLFRIWNSSYCSELWDGITLLWSCNVSERPGQRCAGVGPVIHVSMRAKLMVMIGVSWQITIASALPPLFFSFAYPNTGGYWGNLADVAPIPTHLCADVSCVWCGHSRCLPHPLYGHLSGNLFTSLSHSPEMQEIKFACFFSGCERTGDRKAIFWGGGIRCCVDGGHPEVTDQYRRHNSPGYFYWSLCLSGEVCRHRRLIWSGNNVCECWVISLYVMYQWTRYWFFYLLDFTAVNHLTGHT